MSTPEPEDPRRKRPFPAHVRTTQCRILPSTEWDRLLRIEPFKSRGLPDDPACWVVLVVEQFGLDGEPVIVGTCSLFTAMHWDAWWIDDALAGPTRGVVLRQLLHAGLTSFKDAQVAQVYCGAEDATPEVADLLERFRFTPAAGRLFVLQVADAPGAIRLGAIQTEH